MAARAVDWSRVDWSNYDRAIQLLTRHGQALEYAPPDLQEDREAVIAAVQQDRELWHALDASFIVGQLRATWTRFHEDGLALAYADPALQGDFDVVFAAVKQYGSALEFASGELCAHPDIVLLAVMKDGYALEYAHSDLQANPEIVFAAVVENGYALEFAHPSLRVDHTIVMAAVERRGAAFQFAEWELRSDRNFVLEVVSVSADALEFADEYLRGDHQVVHAALECKAVALQHASAAFRDDPETALFAVSKDVGALQFASQRLLGDFDFMLEAVQVSVRSLEFAAESLRGDPEFMLEAIRLNADSLRYAGKDLRDDREVVLAAAREDGYTLEYASSRLRRDRSCALAAVREDGHALEAVGQELRRDWYVVLVAVERVGRALLYADESLKHDRNFVLEAICLNGRALEYAPKEFREDPELVSIAVRQILFSLDSLRGPELEAALSSLAPLLAQQRERRRFSLSSSDGVYATESERCDDCSEYAATLLGCLEKHPDSPRSHSGVVAALGELEVDGHGEELLSVARLASQGEDIDPHGSLRASAVRVLQRWFDRNRTVFYTVEGQRAALLLAIGLEEMLEFGSDRGDGSAECTEAAFRDVMVFIQEEIPDLFETIWQDSDIASMKVADARCLLHAWFLRRGSGMNAQPLPCGASGFERLLGTPPSGISVAAIDGLGTPLSAQQCLCR